MHLFNFACKVGKMMLKCDLTVRILGHNGIALATFVIYFFELLALYLCVKFVINVSLKLQEMKSRIIQSNYGLNHKQRQNIHHDVRADIGNKIINDLGMNMDAMILYTLLFTNKDITIEDLRQFHRYYVLNTKWLGRAFSMQEDPSYIARHFLEMNDIDLDKWLEEDEREWNDIENDTKDMTLDEFSKYMKVN